ncbi:unnamed protein product [Angiostrongylus costaricensis]|uniref:CEP-1 C-terminal SAM domain-containing protein n=1 Tax=Angiostrongylus costaricensis TaxID=334426 RepID=A0A0R3PAS3_ANGCS|nr:unnamed protein product [Angiostrongylus costaricensis]
MTQRRKPQRVGNCTSKRMRVQEYPVDVTHQIEFHFIDPHKASKCLWFLQNEEKFDQLVCMDIEENPFRDICVPTAGTRIRAWLGKRSIGLASLADEFERHSIFTLGDLARIYRNDIFAGFGFEPDQCAILNKTFYDWYIWNRFEICVVFVIFVRIEIYTRAIRTGNIGTNYGHGHWP